MKIGIVGYGKMGQLIERLAIADGHTVASIIRRGDPFGGLLGCDVAIEFTEPSSAASNLIEIGSLGVPIVCGTTGWLSELERVRSAVPALVYGSNFSIGVAVFSEVVARTAHIMANLNEYEAYGWEAHHSRKKDAPSGTMDSLVHQMRRVGFKRPIDISSTRAGQIPGTHEIGFDSFADTITLRHTARNREGFASGALFAASWIRDRSGVYEFGDVIRDVVAS